MIPVSLAVTVIHWQVLPWPGAGDRGSVSGSAAGGLSRMPGPGPLTGRLAALASN